jgi:hypothetical protein
MPHVPSLPPSDRVYARLDRFEVECPRCGRVVSSWLKVQRGTVRMPGVHDRAPSRFLFNPLTQRLNCPCGVSWVVGVVLYHVQRHANYAQPSDTIPTRRQLAQLRRKTGGVWVETKRDGDDPVNLVVDRPCICERADRWAPDCPIHGDATFTTPQPEPPDPAA